MLCSLRVCSMFNQSLYYQWSSRFRSYNFDIFNSETNSTVENEGWMTSFKVNGRGNTDEYKDGQLISKFGTLVTGSNSGFSSYDGINFSTKIHSVSEHFALIEFVLENSNNSSKQIDIGFYGEIKIGKTENLKIATLNGKIGVFAENPDDNMKLMISALNDSLFDSIWYGHPIEEVGVDPFHSEEGDIAEIQSKDIHVSLGWRDRTILPNSTLQFSFLMGLGSKLHSSPSISVTNPRILNCKRNHSYIIQGNILDVDYNKTFYIKYKYGNKETVIFYSFEKQLMEINNFSFNIPITIDFDYGISNLSIWAEDSLNQSSENVVISFIRNDKPNLTITYISSYVCRNEQLSIKGFITDERFASLFIIYSNKTDQISVRSDLNSFDVSVSISSFERDFFDVVIFAEDELGERSDAQNFTVNLVKFYRPTITVTNHSNDISFIYVEYDVCDDDIEEEVSVSAEVGGVCFNMSTVQLSNSCRKLRSSIPANNIYSSNILILVKAVDNHGLSSMTSFSLLNYPKFSLGAPVTYSNSIEAKKGNPQKGKKNVAGIVIGCFLSVALVFSVLFVVVKKIRKEESDDSSIEMKEEIIEASLLVDDDPVVVHANGNEKDESDVFAFDED